MPTDSIRTDSDSRWVGFLDFVIIAATVLTAGVHVWLAVSPTSPEPQLRTMFVLAALGFLGTLAALYVPLRFLDRLRWLARLGLLAVTVATIVAYFVVVGFFFDTLAIVDKSAEAILVVALLADGAMAAARRRSGADVSGRASDHRLAA
jgi:hypothetical protein